MAQGNLSFASNKGATQIGSAAKIRQERGLFWTFTWNRNKAAMAGWEHVMTQREIEDRRVVARRLYEALCAQFPDKYIALIQPHAPAEERLVRDRIEPALRPATN